MPGGKSDGCARRYWARMTAYFQQRSSVRMDSAHIGRGVRTCCGAMSMAAGEYVSVHSQADTEQADLARERAELKADDKGEHNELMAIYVGRGLDPSPTKQVADQLMARRHRRCPRRTWHLRRPPSDSGLRSREQPYCSRVSPSCLELRCSSSRFGCSGGARGGRRCDAGRNPRHILGCTGHGDYRRRRGLVRNSSMSFQVASPAGSI